MSMPIKKPAQTAGVETEAAGHRIRITLTSRKVKELEKGSFIAFIYDICA